MQLSDYIDHTLLKPGITEQEIAQLCEEAKFHQFAAVCVPPYYVKQAQSLCEGSQVKVATVTGFPFGYSHTKAKKAEILQALEDGADEIDMVANVAAIKDNNWEYLSKELSEVLQPIRLHDKSLKWIIESGDLTDEEIVHCCKLANLHKIDFLKTSTGYGTVGATLPAVALMKQYLDADIKIKASGGIRDKAKAIAYIEAGASRIGTSAGMAIVSKE